MATIHHQPETTVNPKENAKRWFQDSVNPGLINSKRLLNWEGTIEVLDYDIL